ncbi:group III truncated hemoglobin [Ekhidna sp.]
MNDIEDLYLLVEAFYREAKSDSQLGPIFRQFVDDWDPHIRKVASFWESTLFDSGSYRGNPMALHQKVDEILSHKLEKIHFDKWVEIWQKTTDSMFAGQVADQAKQRAANIANIMYIKVYEKRNIN